MWCTSIVTFCNFALAEMPKELHAGTGDRPDRLIPSCGAHQPGQQPLCAHWEPGLVLALRSPHAGGNILAETHVNLRAGTGVTRLTGSSPTVVRINLVDNCGTPIGNLEVDVDPHGADFHPTGKLPSCTNEKFSTAILSRSGCYAGS